MGFRRSNSRSDNVVEVLRLFKVKPFPGGRCTIFRTLNTSTANSQMCREPTRATIAFVVVSRICDNG